MKIDEKQTNYAEIVGIITKNPIVTHKIEGENFLDFEMEVERLSKVKDVIPVTISERTLNQDLKVGDKVLLTGQYRSHNKNVDDKNKLILHFFAKNVVITALPDQNSVRLVGYICKTPVFRTTPFDREICDILLAVNRQNNHRSDYIPCILWGRNARFVANLPVGSKIEISGRIQSRKYIKKLESGENEERMAFEVSCNLVTILEKESERKEII